MSKEYLCSSITFLVTSCCKPCFLGADSVWSCLKLSGEPLVQRKDDTAAVLKSRLEAFHKQTEPVCSPPHILSFCICFQPSYTCCAYILKSAFFDLSLLLGYIEIEAF